MSFARTMKLHRYSPKTIKLYAGKIRRLDSWLSERGSSARSATADELIAYADAQVPFTYGSRQGIINAYKVYWRLHLRRSGPSPSESIRCPKRPRMIYKGLESGEDARLVIKHAKAISPAAGMAVALLYFAGARCAEAAEMPWSADEGEWIHIMGKGAQPRRVPVHEELRAMLDDYSALRSESSYMFPGRYGPDHHVHTQTVYTWVRVAGAAALQGHVHPHRLRYTFGGSIVDETKDLRAAAELMGHAPSSLGITMGYSRSRIVRLKEAIATL